MSYLYFIYIYYKLHFFYRAEAEERYGRSLIRLAKVGENGPEIGYRLVIDHAMQ